MVVATMPWAASSVRLSALMVTCAHMGSSGGGGRCANCGRCHGRSWWCSTVGRPAQAAATTAAAPGFRGSEHRFSTMTRSASASARSTSARVGGSGAAMANPGRRWSTGPAPATERTVQPRRSSACAHFAASTATPSEPPSRNETMHAVATDEL